MADAPPFAWDDRTETTTLPCVGGPFDGSTMPMPPGCRTVRAPGWRGWYEVMWEHRGTTGYRLVWHPDAAPGRFAFSSKPAAPGEAGA